MTSLGQTENISEPGLLVLPPDTFAPETEVGVRFSLFGHRLVEAQGLVVHAKPGVRIGVQFLLLAHDDRNAIAEFVQ